MAKAEFIYNGMKIDIFCNENDTMENIVQKFCQKAIKRKEDLCFLYAGQIINTNLTFNNLANSIDKQRKTISILVTDMYVKNESIYIKQNQNLKNKLNRANVIIENEQAEIQNLKNEITNIKNEDISQINDLLNIIDQKDEIIKKLKEQLNNINNNNL